jgi:hypothetical protein
MTQIIGFGFMGLFVFCLLITGLLYYVVKRWVDQPFDGTEE